MLTFQGVKFKTMESEYKSDHRNIDNNKLQHSQVREAIRIDILEQEKKPDDERHIETLLVNYLLIHVNLPAPSTKARLIRPDPRYPQARAVRNPASIAFP